MGAWRREVPVTQSARILIPFLAGLSACVGLNDEMESFDAFMEGVQRDPCCPGQSTAEALETPACAEIAVLRLRLSAWNHDRMNNLGYRVSYQVARAFGAMLYPPEESLAESLRCPAPWYKAPLAPQPPSPPEKTCRREALLRMSPSCMSACDPSCGIGMSGGVLQVLCAPDGLSWSGGPTPPSQTWHYSHRAVQYRQFPNGFETLSPAAKRTLETVSACMDRCCEEVDMTAPVVPPVDTSYARALATHRLIIPALPDAEGAFVHDGSRREGGESTPLIFLKFTTRTAVPGVVDFYVKALGDLGLPAYVCSIRRTCALGPGADRITTTAVVASGGGFRQVDHEVGLTIDASPEKGSTRVVAHWSTVGAGRHLRSSQQP
jgi:hypothetical protein